MSPPLAKIALPFAPPIKACHNCRKKRWRCDRSLPSCQKCLGAGTECLGYGKLYVWNRGVASRGKMMGKGYENKVGKEDIAANVGAIEVPPLGWDHDQGTREPQRQQKRQHDDFQDANTSLGASVQNVKEYAEESTPMTVQRHMVDPLVQDLNRSWRYYLHHYATQLCEVMVVYDMPGRNPMRDLIPVSSTHPFLLHVIVANSAFHVFNITDNPVHQLKYRGEISPTVSTYYQVVRRFGRPFESYKHALLAKHHALTLLAKNVASVNASNIDTILVTILLFISYALLESGCDKWKVHMDGALKLIRLLGTPPYLQSPMSRLRQTILSDFLVFYILGSTFTFSRIPGLIPETIDLEPILRYAETNNYLSCPGPLLRIMIESFTLPEARGFSHSVDISASLGIQDRVGNLLQRALDFEPTTWSASFERATPYEDINQRIYIASAHRSAVCIYLARVLPSTNPLLDPNSGSALVNLTDLADNVVHHISHLNPGDALFKSICWPLFLAGAESEDKTQREWIMKTLDRLYSVIFWGYLQTSKRLLEAIWKFKDNNMVGCGNCWVKGVEYLGNEILIA